MARKKKAEEEVYHVEVITKARVSEDSDWEYLVKWAGYGSDADSWEPQKNVQQCNRLLSSFWKHVGMDNNDYAIGYEIAAEEDWINKEKQYFAETFVKPLKRTSNKAKKKDRQDKLKSKSSDFSESSMDDSKTSDEEPLARTPAAKNPSRNARVLDTESEPESDGCNQAKVVMRQNAATPPKETPKILTQSKQQEMSSTFGGPPTIGTAKVVAPRTHQDQKINPLVKTMSLSSKSVEAGSSLSTKQRIAAGIPPPRTGPKPLPPPPKMSLPSLSFKKNKLPVPAIPVSGENKDTVIPSTSIDTPAVQPTGPTNDADVVASPQSMDIDQADLFDPTPGDAEPVGGSSAGSFIASLPPKSQKEIDAEKFLQTIVPISLGDPLDLVPDHFDQSTTDLGKNQAISKIPKKWKWTGDLFISTSENETELLCTVTIADPSGTSNSSHINLLLSSLDSLRISKLYPIMDLSPILRACGRPQYFGRLEPNDPRGEEVIQGLGFHLAGGGLAAAIPLLLDGTTAAVLILFTGAQQGLTKVLQVPENLLSGTFLLVGLLPFLVPSTSVAGWKSMDTVTHSSSNSQDILATSNLSQEAVLCQAMSLLCFPKTLLDFLQTSPTSRTYCIWPLSNQSSLELDTAMLQCILKSSKAVAARLEEDVRVIFIANRHLEMLHTMPSLVTKKMNSPEVQFWTYGHSVSMTCERWRVQEIFPLGGVITFTSCALAEDLVGCYQLISQIIEHPLWDCYVIPEVLAVSHLLCDNGDLSSSIELCLGPLLDLINLGSISVMRMPEKGYPSQPAWLSQIINSSDSGHELLEICLKILRSHTTTSGMTAEQLIIFANNEVTKDLSNAQVQPAFMENYRRFVVIRAASESTVPFDKDGLEWSPLSLFSFKDDYFNQ